MSLAPVFCPGNCLNTQSKKTGITPEFTDHPGSQEYCNKLQESDELKGNTGIIGFREE